MKILFVGDIFGRPGRTVLRDHLRDIAETRGAELVVVNAENAAAGFGLTPAIAEEMFELPVDVLTTGNHVWDKRELIPYLESADGADSHARRVLRPANFPAGTPGTGIFEGKTRNGTPYAVINLQGRVFMGGNDDPFRTADALLSRIQAKVILVDMHAEATSE